MEHAYPGLLDSELSGQLVEIFVPFPFEGQGDQVEGGREVEKEKEEEEEEEVDLGMSGEERRGRGGEGEREEDDVFTEDMSPLHSKSPRGVSIPQREGGVMIVGSLGVRGEGERRGRRVGLAPAASSLPSNASSSSSRQRLLVEQMNDTSSWEILSKQSSTSTRFSFKTVSDVVIT